MDRIDIPDKIKDRLLKLKTLADKGYMGEALAARRALDSMLNKYGLSIDDLYDTKAKWRWIKVGSNKELRTILHQCHFQIIDSPNSTYKEYKGEIGFELTPSQYADLMSLFDFHKSQFKKERAKIISNLTKAYIQKHEIWGRSEYDDDDLPKERNPLSWDEIKSILALSESMDDVSYHKQLK